MSADLEMNRRRGLADRRLFRLPSPLPPPFADDGRESLSPSPRPAPKEELSHSSRSAARQIRAGPGPNVPSSTAGAPARSSSAGDPMRRGPYSAASSCARAESAGEDAGVGDRDGGRRPGLPSPRAQARAAPGGPRAQRRCRPRRVRRSCASRQSGPAAPLPDLLARQAPPHPAGPSPPATQRRPSLSPPRSFLPRPRGRGWWRCAGGRPGRRTPVVPSSVRDAELVPHFTARDRGHRWNVTGAIVSSVIENRMFYGTSLEIA
jgi:hypothetical protein